MSRRVLSGQRRGLTLMQLLVLLAVLMAFFGLLLAAVGRARFAHERTASHNSLRQLSRGIIDCANQHDNNVPPGPANWFPRKGVVNNNGYGPMLFHILPYIEQNPLYNSTSKDIGGKRVHLSWKAAGRPVEAFTSAADPTLEEGSDRSSYLINELALPATGARFPSSFPDGTSQTIFFAEGYSQAIDRETFGGQTTLWKTDRRWWDNPTWKPAPGAVLFQLAPPKEAASSVLPQGFIPIAITVGLGDGSARNVSGRCSTRTFYAACTPDGNDILGDDW